MRKLAPLALAVSLACGRTHGPAPATTTRAETAFATTPMLSRFDVVFDAPEGAAIEARITTPSGRVETTSGFASHGRRHVRFTPREPGVHRWEIHAGGREVSRGAVRAVANARSHGFVRVDPSHPHGLVHDDGTTAFVLGENRINVYDPSWNWGDLDADRYVERMASYGMTAIRVFVFSDCESETTPGGYQIGCLEPQVGRFDEKTADAIDVLFDAAERHGVDVVLVAFAIGFTPGAETWRSWADNPYSRLVASPQRFFSDPAMRPHAIERLRYIADRWGSSTRLLAIDLLNEPEWDGPIPERTWIPWAEAMSDAWRRIDPYHHLVTVGSVGLHWNMDGDERPWYASGADDVIQWHLYGKDFYEPHALAAEMTRKVKETWGFGKPVVCGEFAYGGEEKPGYEHTHDGIWSLLMSGAGALAHTAPPFEIDSDEPMTPERAVHFRTLSRFLASFDGAAALSPRGDVLATGGVRAWSLATDDLSARAIWLLAPREKNAQLLADVDVTLDAPRGSWDAHVIDDVSGATLAHVPLSSDGAAPVTMRVPEFARHVAIKVTRARP